MGEIDIAAELAQDNPHVRAITIRIYADALRTYHEASTNILQRGAVCAHPRTGAPLENPYLKIRTQTGAVLAKMPRINSNRVAALLDAATTRSNPPIPSGEDA